MLEVDIYEWIKFSKKYYLQRLLKKIMNSIFVISGLVTILILIIILGYILIRGLPVVNLGFIFSNPIDSGASGGIFPMIVSSLYVTLIAGIVATPLGVGAAVYLVEFAGESKITKLIRFGAETLASIPSIVYGLFGLAFFCYCCGIRMVNHIWWISISYNGTSNNISGFRSYNFFNT